MEWNEGEGLVTFWLEVSCEMKDLGPEWIFILAIYGRRRVGKTFLVRTIFNNQFAFHLTGIANVNSQHQLGQFNAE
jgi:predicted AAA+ superfamily ATPase